MSDRAPTIVLLCKELPERLPPVLNLLAILPALGERVALVTLRATPHLRSLLGDRPIEIHEARPDADERPSDRRSRLDTARHYARFRATTRRVLAQAPRARVWVATGDSALAAGRQLTRRPFVLQLLELYDHAPLFRRLVGPLARRAAVVVVPEPARAAILRVWLRLDHTPLVLPNKPHFHPRTPRMELPAGEIADAVAAFGDRRVVLYQSRMIKWEMENIGRAVAALGDRYVLATMGNIKHDEPFARLRAACPGLVHVPFVPAPDHLAVTSHAHIGLLVYDHAWLNNVFCAPNKTWEYGGFDIPMVCNDLPVLGMQLRHHHAGAAFEIGDVDSIAAAIERVDTDHAAYRAGARTLFESVDLDAIVGQVIERLDRPGGANRQASTPAR